MSSGVPCDRAPSGERNRILIQESYAKTRCTDRRVYPFPRLVGPFLKLDLRSFGETGTERQTGVFALITPGQYGRFVG